MKCPGRKESPTGLPGAEWKPSQDGEQAEGSGPGSGPRGRSERLLVPEGTGEDFFIRSRRSGANLPSFGVGM